MSTTRIKEKLSVLLPSQLPEFIRADFTTFVAFLEAYYEFLEQDQYAQELLQNARSYNDIDATITSFIEYFYKQYSNDIPRDVLFNKKALLKNIKDLYNNRGNEKSYKLLFKILYNKDVEIFYPYTQVLKASDGKWIKRTSFFMKTIVGNGNDIIDKNVIIESTNTKFIAYIDSRRAALTSQGISSDVHEYFFDNSKNVPINIGDTIEFGGFKGEVVGVPTSLSISNPGSGFKIGNILTLTSGLGNTAKVKITKVNSTGGILNAEFITFGYGYSDDFFNYFSSNLQPAPGPANFNFESGNVTITGDVLNGFVERGTITSQTYAASSYFAEDYQGDLLREFFTSTSTVGISEGSLLGSSTSASGLASDAAIYVRVGTKANYPGYYENINGFLSDNIYVQNENYFQPYSYVLKIDERLSLYKKAVLDLLHPAGMKLFGELTLDTGIDISSEITATLRYLTSNLQDVEVIQDSDSKFIGKILTDEPILSELVSKLIEKPFNDVLGTLDEATRNFLRPVSDNIVPPSDSDSKLILKNVNTGGVYAFQNYFAEDYVEDSDASVIEDSSSITVINNSSEILLTTDSGNVLFTDYAESYFAEDYVGISTAF